MTDKASKTRKKPTMDTLAHRKALTETLPMSGKVRVPQIAAHLGIGASTWWLYVNQGRVLQPVKYGARVAVWDAEYIRDLADKGIPAKPEQAV